MGKMVLEISEDLSEALRVPPQEQSSRLCRELAVRLYEKGVVSFGKRGGVAGGGGGGF